VIESLATFPASKMGTAYYVEPWLVPTPCGLA
jgi:hypothetical protein